MSQETNEVISQLKDLAEDCKSRFSDDGDDDIHRADYAGLNKAVEMLATIAAKDAEIVRLTAALDTEKKRAGALEWAMKGNCQYCINHNICPSNWSCEIDDNNKIRSWQFDEARFAANESEVEHA